MGRWRRAVPQSSSSTDSGSTQTLGGPWVDAFDEASYSAGAVGWPGDAATVAETRANRNRVAGHGIADVVAHHAHEIGKLDRKPIVVGHSFGGLIAQRLLSGGFASAAVAIDPAPAKGVLFLPASALRVASIALRNPGNRNGAVSLTKEQFRYGFGQPLSQEESRRAWGAVDDPVAGQTALRGGAGEPRAALACSRRPQERDAGAAADHGRRKDDTVPAAVSRQTQKLYRKSSAITDLWTFADRGHSLTIDSGWREVADSVLGWLGEHDL